MSNNNNNNISYDASSIEKEEGSNQYRKRVAQYLDSKGIEGIENQFFEVLDNAIDEAVASTAELKAKYNIERDSEVNVHIKSDGSVLIQDFGRGYPCDLHPTYNIPGIIICIEHGSAGGKNRGTSGYDKTTKAGVHGAGITVSMANCEYFQIETDSLSGNGKYILGYTEGVRTTELTKTAELTINPTTNLPQSGTIIRYKYSSETMELSNSNGRSVDFPYAYHSIIERLKYSLIGQKDKIKVNFKFRDQPIEVITPQSFTPEDYLNFPNTTEFEIDNMSDPNEPFKALIVLGINQSATLGLAKFQSMTVVNRLKTDDSTSNKALEDAISNLAMKLIPYYRQKKAITDMSTININDFTDMFRCFIRLDYPNAEYRGQTKKRMSSTRLIPIMSEKVEQVLSNNPNFIQELTQKVLHRVKKREELDEIKRKLKEKEEKRLKMQEDQQRQNELMQKVQDGTMTADELDDKKRILVTSSRVPEEQSTMILVEGSSVKALLNSDGEVEISNRPLYVGTLTGKISNAKKRDESTYMTAVFRAKILEQNYKEIAIFTDGDVDGLHIKILVIYMILRYKPSYITNGNLYIIPSPYSLVSIPHPISFHLKGYGQKSYQPGQATTFSQSEHKMIVKHGGRAIKYFTGLADANLDPKELLINRDLWQKVDPPTANEVELINMLLTPAHTIKRAFTSRIYSEELIYSMIANKALPDLLVKKPGDITSNTEYSDKPNLIGYEAYLPKFTKGAFGLGEV